MKNKGIRNKRAPINRLTSWEWKTLVAAWRYYELRHTIASMTFPADIVERFWGANNPYSDEVRTQIARQFARIDHGISGEKDWTQWIKPDYGGAFDCDYSAWTTFYQFCRGWVDSYAQLTVSNGKRTEKVNAFWTEFTKRWRPVDGYIAHPLHPPYIPEEYIVKDAKERK